MARWYRAFKRALLVVMGLTCLTLSLHPCLADEKKSGRNNPSSGSTAPSAKSSVGVKSVKNVFQRLGLGTQGQSTLASPTVKTPGSSVKSGAWGGKLGAFPTSKYAAIVKSVYNQAIKDMVRYEHKIPGGTLGGALGNIQDNILERHGEDSLRWKCEDQAPYLADQLQIAIPDAKVYVARAPGLWHSFVVIDLPDGVRMYADPWMSKAPSTNPKKFDPIERLDTREYWGGVPTLGNPASVGAKP